MQTLYGIKCSDRFKVVERVVGFDAEHDKDIITYEAYFDGAYLGRFSTGRAAVHAIEDRVNQLAAERVAKEEAEAKAREARQERDDTAFLDELAYDLKVDRDRLDEFIAIAIRRMKEE